MKSKNVFTIWKRNWKTYEIEPQDKGNEPGKLKTILKSLRYADKKDSIMLTLSIFSAIVIGFINPFNIYFFFTPIMATVIKAETQGNPYNVTLTEEIPRFIKYSYGYLINGGVAFIFCIIQIMTSEIASRNIMAKIKTAYLTKMLFIEVGWYDESQDQFVTTVSQDLQKMMILFDSKMTNVIEILSFFFFGCIAGFAVSWKVALLTLGMMLFVMIVIYFILQKSKVQEKSRQQFNRKSTKIASEVLGNTHTVAAYGGGYKELERYKNTLKMVNKYGLKHTVVISVGKAFNYFQLCLCYLVAYYFSARLYLLSDFEPSYIAVILTAQINAIYHSIYLLSAISDLYMATDSAYRIIRFLDKESSYSKSIEQGIEPDIFKADISFKNVNFSYPTNLQTKVLHGLTLDIVFGKVTAVVGTSGAGKSTIVNLITRLHDVTAGQILIGGVDIKKLNISWLRNQIGVVGQEPTLFDISIEENIRYGKTDATLDEIIEAAKLSYAHNFIKKLPLGYNSIVGERGIKLSVGQKQRIAIARAIVRKNKLLLLDEATSALDVHSEGIVQEALDNAMHDRTTLIIAHRMSTVRKADVIYTMKEGHVMEKGSHSELMKLKGYYYSLTKIQELEEKDKDITLNHRNISQEKLIEERTSSVDESLEFPQIEKLQWLSLRNLKMLVVWFLAILFTISTSTFLPFFFYIYTLFCQSFTYTKDELSRIALFDAGYLFGLGAIISFSVVLSGVMSTIATQLWLKKLQEKAFKKIVSMEMSWFDRSRNSPNECLEVLTNSPQLIESVTGDKAAQVVIAMLSLLFSLGYSFFVSTSITLMNLPLFLIFIIMNCLRMKSRDSDTLSASLTTRSTKVASEYVQNVKTIQMLNCQKYILNHYEDMLVCSKKEAIVSIAWYAAVYGFSKTLIQWSMATLFIYGVNFMVNDNIKGTLLIGVVSSLSLASMLIGPALALTSQYPAARQAMKQLYRIAYAKTSLNTLTDQKAKPKIYGNIVFQDVMFSYPTREKVQVLKKLNLKIEAGTTVALVGDSGCGKTTIISLLERFYLPTKGKIAYDTMVGERGSKLSGGQKQRIAIARAVLRNPKILLLDEATSSLDSENEKVVQEALENASNGRTNIVIAHRLSTIRKADKIVVLQDGAVIEEGNHEQLMEKRGYYFKLISR
ncbi:phosphatidylcholine translocator ABCB4 isoform X2 [Halyomorpha halys]|uniref:phosphatidylcholine translocator ABCB4 isoform X2 n=1 Tax=Halyomorpha halys TaxID=286706 RepID=UPI0006D4ECD3|nr:phosphatidylcholine translocator ABCB4-like isoform X2 [Halyomorpha halys]